MEEVEAVLQAHPGDLKRLVLGESDGEASSSGGPTSTSVPLPFTEESVLMNRRKYAKVDASSAASASDHPTDPTAQKRKRPRLGSAPPPTAALASPDGPWKKWVALAELIPGRTDIQCREKWTNRLDPTLNLSAEFSAREDALLLRLLPVYGIGSWAKLSLWFVGRTDAQLLKRYKYLKAQSESPAPVLEK